MDAVLQLGPVSESVTVVDAPPLLQTETSSVGTVLTNEQIVDLPLNGRDYLPLAALSPGTIPSTGKEGVSIGGQAGLQVAFLLDGEDNNDPRRLYKTAAVPGTPYTFTLANISRQQLDAYSDFNALQLKAEKRYSQGLTFLAGYTYSKVIAFDDSSGVQNYYNQAAERAVSGQDLKHHFVGSAVYELPFGRGKPYGENWNRVIDGILAGWSITPIITANTGFPINLSVRGNPSNTGGKDRPNVVGDWNLAPRNVSEWFNPAAFAKNPKYTFGNAGRNILRGPGLLDLDLGLHKSVQISERVSVQLRMESFNATNTPPLGDPNTQVGNRNLGKISSAGTPRDNQFAVKILF